MKTNFEVIREALDCIDSQDHNNKLITDSVKDIRTLLLDIETKEKGMVVKKPYRLFGSIEITDEMLREDY